MLINEVINLDDWINELSNNNFNSGATPIKDVALLLYLIRLSSPGSIVEIGTHLGETTKYFSLKFPDRFIYTIDCLDPNVLSEEQRNENPSISNWGKFVKNIPNVLLINCNSRLLNYNMLVNPTFIFIDGDHTHEGVLADTTLALQALTKSKESVKILAWHDFWIKRDHNDCSWVGVTDYIINDISVNYDVRYCEGTNVCYTIL